jgi:hypothetical protein
MYLAGFCRFRVNLETPNFKIIAAFIAAFFIARHLLCIPPAMLTMAPRAATTYLPAGAMLDVGANAEMASAASDTR